MKEKFYSNLTNLYSLTKTLRFELIPESATKKRLNEWIQEYNSNVISNDNFVAIDYKKMKAYNNAKHLLDILHENYINIALESEIAKSIDISKYFELYCKKDNAIGYKKELINEEKELRSIVGNSFGVAEEYYVGKIKDAISKFGKEMNLTSRQEESVLTDKNIIKYVRKNADELIGDKINNVMIESLCEFDGFFGYLNKYNENRNNYYKFKDENAASIATRIVTDNLPIFCDNIITFENNQEIYNSIYEQLKNEEKELKIKDYNGNEKNILGVNTKIFDLENFKECLSQNGIYIYNDIVSEWNLIINLYNQMNSKDKSFIKLAQFSKLKKQIGCGMRKSLFFAIEKDWQNDLDDSDKGKDVILSVERLLKKMAEKGEKYLGANKESTLQRIIDYILSSKDYAGFYWNSKAIDTISNKYFANWHSIKDKLYENKVWSCVSYDKKRDEQIKINDAVEIVELFKILDKEDKNNTFKQNIYDMHKDIIDKNKTVSECLINFLILEINDNVNYFEKNKSIILNLKKYKERNIEEGEEDINILLIKSWFDSVINILSILKFFSIARNKIKGKSIDSELYNYIEEVLHPEDAQWNIWYDGIRNYLTKKEYDKEKENMIRLNFNSAYLDRGWSLQYKKALINYEGNKYLCIFKSEAIFKEGSDIYNGDSAYLIKNVNLKFKTLMGKGFKSFYGKAYSEIKTEDGLKAVELAQKYIMKNMAKKYPILQSICYGKFTSVKEFENRVDALLSDITGNEYVSIEWGKIVELEKNGDIFLFKISTKDIKEKAEGKPDLQTIYWNDVLQENSEHRLCGGSQFFMRNSISREPRVIHKKGSILINKRLSSGLNIPKELYLKITSMMHNVKNVDEAKQIIIDNQLLKKYDEIHIEDIGIKIATHDIVKDKRFYGNEKFLFYCPIELNYSRKKYGKKVSLALNDINNRVNEIYSKQIDKLYIGIDRGERHLIYISILDKDGQIVLSEPWDSINETNYLSKLEDISDLRKNERKSWQKIDSISKLKEGYISNVVHMIVKRLIDKPSFVVMEDLNTKFKNNRVKIEKSIYQKFEVALGKKLNFIVDKEINEPEVGSIKNAIQLTPPLNNYKDIENKKQFGVMLYTRANYTSVTDPVTGWRRTVYLKKDNEENIKKQVLKEFQEIGFDGKDYFFEYVDKNTGKMWKLYSSCNGISLPRYRYGKTDKNVPEIENIDLVKILDELFSNFDKQVSIKKQIENGKELKKINGRKETAWQSLIFVINIIQQIRNNGIKENDKNFLYSPVRDENGKHFDSRECDNNKLPADADANGAFNIARKGIIMDEHIRFCYNNKIDTKNINLFVSDEEWDWWLQDRNEWNNKLEKFAVKGK